MSSSGKVTNERIVTLEEGHTIYVRRASGKDDARKATITNLNFRNTHLSKTHALLKYENHGFHIKDLDSTFGTVVNSRFIARGTWFPLTSGDQLGFIVAKPSGVISDVRSRYTCKASFPVLEFGKASLGLEFLIETNKNTIKFIPKEVYEVVPEEDLNSDSDLKTTPDHTREVVELVDEQIVLSDNDHNQGKVGMLAAITLASSDEESFILSESADEEEQEDDDDEDDEEAESCLYNLGTCPGMAGTIQRFDPPTEKVEAGESENETESAAALLQETVKNLVSKSKENLGSLRERFSSSRIDISESDKHSNEVKLGPAQTNEAVTEVIFSMDDRPNSNEFPIPWDLSMKISSRACVSRPEGIQEEASTESKCGLKSLLSPELDADLGTDSENSNFDLDTETGFDTECDSSSGSEVQHSGVIDYLSESSDLELESQVGCWKGLKYGGGENVFVSFNGEETASDDDADADPWCSRGITDERVNRKRTRGEIEKDEEEVEKEEEGEETSDEELVPPVKRAKKSSSLLKSIAKEAGKGAIYVLATITALGVYGSTLNAQKQ